MKKNAILKKIDIYENKIIDIIHEFRDFLDTVEDPDISSMGEDFYQFMVDNLYENDIVTINDIKEFVQNEYEQ
jgi:flagellin-specific chaperone FliS